MSKIVIKRDGTTEEYNLDKIRQSIAFACQKANKNPIELESRLQAVIFDGITTKKIQEEVIRAAVTLASPTDPDWLIVAGNAFAMDMHHQFNVFNLTLKEVFDRGVELGIYKPEAFSSYSNTDFDNFNNEVNHDYDYDHSYSSLLTAKKKYLSTAEANQWMHMLNAMALMSVEPTHTREAEVIRTYHVLAQRKISLATPQMLNLRSGGALGSCFIVAPSDNLDSIMDNVKKVANISKNGGGVGVFLGYLRAKGSMVAGYKDAAGCITQWVKIFNSTLVAVNQKGKRSGAGTIALPIWHNDVQDFLDMQTESGDMRLKSFDIFPQVVVNDVFMERIRDKGQWVTFCPYEVQHKLGIELKFHGDDFREMYHKIEVAAMNGELEVFRIYENARDLEKLIFKVSFVSGLPYWFFIDEANRRNPNVNDPESPGILCGNLCQESFSNIRADDLSHICSLLSLNLSNIENLEEIGELAKLGTKLLNNGIELTKHTDSSMVAHNNRYRTIGIGIMGLHDYLAKNFDNFNNKELISEIAECIEYNAVLESVEQAKRLGSFEAFEYSGWKSGETINQFKRFSSSNYDWDYAQEMINKYGMCNSQLTSPAPTTTTSIYQDASSSFLPVLAPFFSEDNSNGLLRVASKYLSTNPIGYGKNQTMYRPKEIIDICAELQKFTDTGISMELYIDHNWPEVSAKMLHELYLYAWEKNLKSVYYLRHLKKNASITVQEDACASCSG